MNDAAQDPAAEPEGVKCPSCHCRHLPVKYTRHYGATTVRVRECRHCGREIRTTERIVNDDVKRRSA